MVFEIVFKRTFIIDNSNHEEIIEHKRVPCGLQEIHHQASTKRPNLDTKEIQNYRPGSSLHFVPKLLKKLVVTRVEEHMSSYNLLVHDPLQSENRSKHSTETVVLN